MREAFTILIAVCLAGWFSMQPPAAHSLPQEIVENKTVDDVAEAPRPVLAQKHTGEEATTLPALLVTDSGYYFLVTNQDGVPNLQSVPQVIRLGSGTPPDVPPPNTPPESDVTKQVRTWAGEVNDPAGAQALAIVYKTVAQSVSDGRIKPKDGFSAVKQATDEVLKATGGGGDWNEWRSNVGDLITGEMQTGGLTTAAEVSSFLNDVAKGLEGSSAEEAALNPELIKAIIELILKIIEIFASNGGSPV